MQPVCVYRSNTAGLLYLNGKFAGEIGGDVRATVPVSPQGALYVELRPLEPGVLPLACRIAFSGGKPIPESLENETRLKAVYWPCGALDIDLEPETLDGEPKPAGATTEPETQGACGAALRTAGSIREGALYPGLLDEEATLAIREADAIVPMQYALATGDAAIGLVTLHSPAYASVAALRYASDAEGRLQKMWL